MLMLILCSSHPCIHSGKETTGLEGLSGIQLMATLVRHDSTDGCNPPGLPDGASFLMASGTQSSAKGRQQGLAVHNRIQVIDMVNCVIRFGTIMQLQKLPYTVPSEARPHCSSA